MILMIFSTVLAPQDPALTVESLAISATGRPPTCRSAGDDAIGRQPVGRGVGEDPVLGEAAGIGEQRDALTREELASRLGCLVVFRRAALLDLGADARQVGVAGDLWLGLAAGPEGTRGALLVLHVCHVQRVSTAAAGV